MLRKISLNLFTSTILLLCFIFQGNVQIYWKISFEHIQKADFMPICHYAVVEANFTLFSFYGSE